LKSEISFADVRKWLMKQNTYTLHKQKRKFFQRNKVLAEKVNEQYQADLVDMQMFHRNNAGNKYILTVVDVFSKYAFAIPLKSKTSGEIIKESNEIFKKESLINFN